MGELNKIVAGLCSSLLVLLGLNFFGEQIFHGHGPEELAFALEIEEVDTGDEAEEIDLAALFAAADPAAGESVFKKCKSCHKVEDGANGTGPHLWGVVGRAINGADGFTKYSGGLPDGETWTASNLYEFLESPAGWSQDKTGKKTSMSFKGLRKPEDRADLIAYLNQADGSPEPLE